MFFLPVFLRGPLNGTPASLLGPCGQTREEKGNRTGRSPPWCFSATLRSFLHLHGLFFTQTFILRPNPGQSCSSPSPFGLRSGAPKSERLCLSGVFCPPPEEVKQGYVVAVQKTEYEAGFEIHYLCKKNFLLDGPQRVTCLPNGTWSQSPPFCRGKACVSEAPPRGPEAGVDDDAFPQLAASSRRSGAAWSSPG